VSGGARTLDHLDHNQELYQLSYAHQACSNLAPRSAPGRTRTCDLLLRRQPLYPAELQGPTPRLDLLVDASAPALATVAAAVPATTVTAVTAMTAVALAVLELVSNGILRSLAGL
jgi:hypothetical protein